MESGVPYGAGGREINVVGSSTSGVDPASIRDQSRDT